MLENFDETDMFLNFSFSDFDFRLLSIKKCILQFFRQIAKNLRMSSVKLIWLMYCKVIKKLMPGTSDLPCWIHQFPFEHWLKAASGQVSIWTGKYLGAPVAAGMGLDPSDPSLEVSEQCQIGASPQVVAVSVLRRVFPSRTAIIGGDKLGRGPVQRSC